MEGDLDPFEFVLAESLHMTLDEMRRSMSNREFVQWQAFYVWRNAQRELASKEAK